MSERPLVVEDGIDYRPSGILEIDIRPIPAEVFEHWRKQKPRKRWKVRRLDRKIVDYPTPKELGEWIGVKRTVVQSWRENGLGPPFAAAFRLWLFEHIPFTYKNFPRDLLVAFAWMCGGYHKLAEHIGRSASTVRSWRANGYVPAHGGAGALMWALQSELQLKPMDAFPTTVTYGTFDAHEVREIRKRWKDGERQVDIAEDFDVNKDLIHLICRRKTYKWVS